MFQIADRCFYTVQTLDIDVIDEKVLTEPRPEYWIDITKLSSQLRHWHFLTVKPSNLLVATCRKKFN